MGPSAFYTQAFFSDCETCRFSKKRQFLGQRGGHFESDTTQLVRGVQLGAVHVAGG